MSKRNSVGTANTLFNYFSKTPPNNKKVKLNLNVDTAIKVNPASDIENGSESMKRERQITPSPEVQQNKEDESPIAPKRRKRIRLNPLDSDDSDAENKVDNKNESPTEKTSFGKKLQDSFKYEPNDSPKGKKTKKDNVPQIKCDPQEKPVIAEEGDWVHCKLEWLKQDKIKDAKGRRPDHPEYDPTTLYVPKDFMNSQTPAHRQWWELKSAHYDCVLFFKVGKFYELYHMDAAVGVNELGFSYMKGEFAHSGFPESAYARMSSTLVSKGYKVARVEQTETPDMMQERCKREQKSSKYDKVVRREICQVAVRGAQVCGVQDTGPADSNSAFMMAIAEEENNGISTYGVCFVDTSIGQFHMGQFKDDKHSSRLLTTLAHFPPALTEKEGDGFSDKIGRSASCVQSLSSTVTKKIKNTASAIIYDRKSCTLRTSKLLATHCHSARRETQTMTPPEKTLKLLAEKYYMTGDNGEWPEGIKSFLHEGDALGLTPAPNCYLAVKALGGCVAYLTTCLLDIQILGMSQFSEYSPPDVFNTSMTMSQTEKTNLWTGGTTMVLDSITLRNLRIVQDEGCLYDKLNMCSTPMGKRLLYQWVCSPSSDIKVIKERQEAIKALFEDQNLCQEAKSVLASLPDLERLLAKVHALGNLKKSKEHPDSRAILYEEKTYSKRKVLDFISILNGYNAALKLSDLFSETDSALLKRITQLAPDGKFPDYTKTLKFFKEAFNQAQAEKEGIILPGAGVDQEYDNTLLLIKDIEDELKEYLAEQEKYFKCRLNYVGSDKKRYQIEIPQNAAAKAASDYHLEGARKGFKRFSTAETKDFLARMMAAEEQKRVVLKDLSRRIFEKFSSHYAQWSNAVQCISTLDVLLSLSEFARLQTGDVCLPEVTFDCDAQPYINIVEGRHPCIPIVNDFIPNDTALGEDRRSLLLLTGPNMGGKSTLMRQVGLLTVLAHLGSYVPAQECKLSLVDRIFTRLGASDDILSGQSTFLVEMNETAAIIKHATPHSLVLLDELGRGTSTYDGTAIASGVCAELAERHCRVIFSTHYHSLVKHLGTHSAVQLGHMACMVEIEEVTETEENIPEETITFLYKLSPGACPKSYGFNAARLAGIPPEITRRARAISKQLETEANIIRAFKNLMKVDRPADVKQLLVGLTL
ncbi:unnamed protein product [Leptosia nina]|uniref:DNA mismatch repair protein n=1 Tax=Leptosia nina TaxID=320188 RepID=A0AAV1J849_9NEOP